MEYFTKQDTGLDAAIAAEEQAIVNERRQAGDDPASIVPAAGSEWSQANIGQSVQNLWDNIQGWEGFEGLTTWPDRPSQEQVDKAEGAQLAATTRAGPAFGAQQTSEQNQRFIEQGIDIYGGGAESAAVDASYMPFVAKTFPETYKVALQDIIARNFNKANNEKFDSSVFDVRLYEDEPTWYNPLEEKRQLLVPRGAVGTMLQQGLVEHAPILAGLPAAVAGMFVGPVTSLMAGSLAAGFADWYRSDIGLTRAGFEFSENRNAVGLATEKSDPDGVFGEIDFGVWKHPKTGDKISGLQVMVDAMGEGTLWAALQVGGGVALSVLRNSMAQLGGKLLGVDTHVSAEFLRSINPEQFLKAMEHYKLKQASGDTLAYGRLGTDEGPTTSQVLYTYAEAAKDAGRLEEAAALNAQASKAAKFESEAVETGVIRERQEMRAADVLGSKGETGLATRPRFVLENSERLGPIIRDTQTMEPIELAPTFIKTVTPEKKLEFLQRYADDLNAEMGYPITALERDAAAGEAGAVIREVGEEAALLNPRLAVAQEELSVARTQAQNSWDAITATREPETLLRTILPEINKTYTAARASADKLFTDVTNAFTLRGKTPLKRIPPSYNQFDLTPLFRGTTKLEAKNKKSLVSDLDKAVGGPGESASQAESMVRAALTETPTVVGGRTVLTPKTITYQELTDTINGVNELFRLPRYSEGAAREVLTNLKNGLINIRDKRFAAIDKANLSSANREAGMGLASNYKAAEVSWANFDNIWRESTLAAVTKFGKKSTLGYTAEQAAKDFFPEGNNILQGRIIKAVLSSKNPVAKEILRGLFRVKFRNSVAKPVEADAQVAGVGEVAPGVVVTAPPVKVGKFLEDNRGAFNKLFTYAERQEFESVGLLSKTAQDQATKTAALQNAAEKAGVELTDANIIGVHGLVEPMMSLEKAGGASYIRNIRDIIFRNTENNPAALQAARQRWDAVRYAGAERMIFGEADLTAVGTLERISDPGAILKNIKALRGSYEALVGEQQAKDVKMLLNRFSTAFDKIRRPAGAKPSTVWATTASVVGTLVRPIVGVLNRRAITATAARNLFTMSLADKFKIALLNPQATANWVKMVRSLKKGEDAAQLVGTALGYDYFNEEGELWKTVLDSLHSGPKEAAYEKRIYARSPEYQETVGAEVRRGQSPAPKPPLHFLKEWDAALRQEVPWLNQVSGALQTRPQDQPPPQAAAQAAQPTTALSTNRGIASLPTGRNIPTGTEVLREDELSKLVRGFNKGGIVNARPRRQIVL